MSSSLTAAVFVIITCLASGILTENDTKPAVYFSLIVSGGENGFKSSGIVPAIDIALEAIDTQLLPGYNLTYETPPRNSKVSYVIATKCKFQHTFTCKTVTCGIA